MKIIIASESLPPQFWWDPKRPERGTEKFYVRTAEALVQMGHSVKVLWGRPPTHHNGVAYGQFYRSEDADLMILCNPTYRVDELVRRATDSILWTNFVLPDYRGWLKAIGFSDQGDIVAISQYARSLMAALPRVRIVGHGVDSSVFRPGSAPRRREVCFTSSPDRGLVELRRIWKDRDVVARTGYSLWASSYGQGRLSEAAVAKRLAEADFWIHPGIGNELFCIAAIEAQASGCSPIVVGAGALPEVVRNGRTFPDIESMQEGIVEVLTAGPPSVKADGFPSWRDVTEILTSPYTNLHGRT